MKLTWYFDVISPYTALGWQVLMRYKDLWGIDIELKPILLGGVMGKTGNQPPSMLGPRGVFLGLDLQRSAQFFNVPLLETPSNFFEAAKKVIAVQRLLVAAVLEGLSLPALCELVSAFTAGLHFDRELRSADNEVSVDDGFLTHCMKASGVVDAPLMERLLAASKGPEAKLALQANTEEAVKAGTYGSPSMVVDGEFFFGSDRFEQIAFLKGLVWRGPDPARARL
eukprot:TRINITY_DN5170_c0_g1_i1.p1 TRINITY_DN5170_c0_g1~~TRINITY_DN5170_c0_g1_i1.p1  ORF type:complete len:225 (+),score=44.15 TRINITY_DN5170_c0_g1_i1:142-816(+)